MITLCLMIIAGLMLTAAIVQIWEVIVGVAVAVIVLAVFVIVLAKKKRRQPVAASADDLRAQAAAYRARQAVSAPVSPNGTILRIDEPVRPQTPFPPVLGDACVPVYTYDDVLLSGFTRTAAGFARLHEPVELRVDGETVQVIQNSRCIGTLPQNALSRMVREWQAAGDPIFADLAAFNWNGGRAVVRLGFYRDELPRMRKRPNAFSCRLTALPEEVPDELPGQPCTVAYDEARSRYDVLYREERIGSLPPSAIEKIHATDREPEDVDIRVERFEPEANRVHIVALIA